MATLTFYKRQYDAILCVHMCDGVQRLRAGDKPDQTSVCVCLCVCSVVSRSVDWLVDRKFNLNRS